MCIRDRTEGKELPDIAVDELTGDVDRYKDFFAALEKTSPVPIAFEKIEGGSHAVSYTHLAKSLDRHYIGIEINSEYCALAGARIGGVEP